MTYFKKFVLIALAVIVQGLMMGLPCVAGTESLADQISFELTDATTYIAGATDIAAGETATIQFKAAFDNPGAVGNVDGAYFRIVFDPDYVEFVEASIGSAWDGSSATADPARIDDEYPENEDTVIYDITAGSPFAPLSGYQAYAEFTFQLKCQPDEQVNPIDILYDGELTFISTTVNNYVVETGTRVNHGSVINETYNAELWLADTDGIAEYEGALGTHIYVPVLLQSDFRVGAVDVYFEYDPTRLHFTSGDFIMSGDYFTFKWVNGSDGLVRILVWEGNPEEPFTNATEILQIGFTVLGDWQGDQTALTIADVAYTPKITLNTGGSFCVDVDETDHTFNDGWLQIPAYTAGFSAALPDGDFSVWDDVANVRVDLTNNFPAGLVKDSIIANLNLDQRLDPQYITDEVIDFDLATRGGGVELWEVGVRRYTAAGFMDEAETPQLMAAFRVDRDALTAWPVTFEERLYDINFQTPYNASPQFSARVVDTTGQVNLYEGAGLTWTQPDPIEFLMGEYYAPAVQAGNCDLAQTYYLRNSFPVTAFKVKIEVSGPHYMKSVDPIAGVELVAFDDVAYKWVVLETEAGVWTDKAPSDVISQFAIITYTRWNPSELTLKDTPSDPDLPDYPTGFWTTRTSSVTFIYDDDPTTSGDNDDLAMTEATTNLEHLVVASAGNVVSKWWTDAAQNHQLTGFQVPETYELRQNYPNPFNPSTEVAYGLPEAGHVELAIYNVAGQRVETLVSGWQDAGWQTVVWNAGHVASGVYFYRLQAGNFVETRKMVLLK